jgi:serine/threonine protein kinase
MSDTMNSNTSSSSTSIDAAFHHDYAAGHVISSKYVLEQRLGEGGGSGVWRARNLALGSGVALKLLQGMRRTADAVEQLLREARIEASFQEPGVVRVFDVEQNALGDTFIAMELLEGQSLAALLEERGRLEAVEAVRLLLPVVAVLVAVHARGAVHGDLEAANIVLVPMPGGLRPTLIDFGGLDLANPVSDATAVCRILREATAGPATDEAATSLERILAPGFATIGALGVALAQFLLARGVSTDASGVEVAEAWLRARSIRTRRLCGVWPIPGAHASVTALHAPS